MKKHFSQSGCIVQKIKNRNTTDMVMIINHNNFEISRVCTELTQEDIKFVLSFVLYESILIIDMRSLLLRILIMIK